MQNSSLTPGLVPQADQLLTELMSLRQFAGEPNDFWMAYLGAVGQLVASPRVMVLAQAPGGAAGWSLSWSWPELPPGQSLAQNLLEHAAALATQSINTWHAALTAQVDPSTGVAGASLTAFALDVTPGHPGSVVVFAHATLAPGQLDAALLVLRLTWDVPASYYRWRTAQVSHAKLNRFEGALDLMLLLNRDTRFVKAAMTVTNEVAGRFDCSRVSLGWHQRNAMRLIAMSHVEKVEGRTGAIEALENAMEECLEQDEEIVWPREAGPGAVCRAHQEYSSRLTSGSLVSLPLRMDDQVVAVLTCERTTGPFCAEDVWSLRLLLDQATRRLVDLEREDRWLGARLFGAFVQSASRLLGAEHTVAKLSILLALAVIAYGTFGTREYRIEAPFILKTDDLSVMPAPFDGYIKEVKVRIGDSVKKGDQLLALDTRELILEQAAAAAEMSRHAREAEKHRAKSELAEMEISRANEEQAKARLARVEYYVENARLKAPFDGVIVEGDLKKMLGAPVRKGDVLFKIAAINTLYPEIDVSERDVHEVRPGGHGEILLVSRPQHPFPIDVGAPDPVAVIKEGANVFTVRGRLSGAPDLAWRPGMTGLAKIDAGRRNVTWILTHRTIDTLRMWTWW